MNNTDASGRWGRTVHYDSTRIWARKVGYPGEAASAIAEADNAVDSISGGTSPAPGVGDQSYHFNRNFSGEDSRFVHFKEHCSSAKKLCAENDNPEAAAEQLGTALHPLQDYVAHGDYFIFCHEPILRIHNSHSPQRDFGEPENYPDDTRLDVQGSPDGRATIRFMKYRNNTTDQDYAIYEWGHKRIQMTKSATEMVLEEYLEHIKSHGKCRCKQYFGVE